MLVYRLLAVTSTDDRDHEPAVATLGPGRHSAAPQPSTASISTLLASFANNGQLLPKIESRLRFEIRRQRFWNFPSVATLEAMSGRMIGAAVAGVSGIALLAYGMSSGKRV